MRAVPVVVVQVHDQHCLEVSEAENEHAVETLAAQGPDNALADGVGPGRGDGSADDLDAFSGEEALRRIRQLRNRAMYWHRRLDATNPALAQAFERRRGDLAQAAQDYYVRHLIDREQFLAVRDGLDRALVREHQELLPLRVRETLKRLGRRSPRAAWNSFDVGQRREMLDHVVVDSSPLRGRFCPERVETFWLGQGSLRPTATRAVAAPKRRRTRPGETFSTKQAADYLGVSPVHLASLIRRGELDATRGTHGWEITQTAIDAFLEERRVTPTRVVAP